MRLFSLLALCIASASSVQTGFGGLVFTSSDFDKGMDKINRELATLLNGKQHRVYAVYSYGYYHQTKWMDNVKISGSNGVVYNVTALAEPFSDGGYALNPSNQLTAPIKISDTNNVPQTGRLPYTIYIVSSEVPVFQVLSAQLANGPVHCDANESSPGCTILSAEPAMQLSGHGAGVWIAAFGFDVPAHNQQVTTVSSDIVNSVVVSGPIATIHSKNVPSGPGVMGGIDFTIQRKPSYDVTLSAGAMTSLISNGWFSVSDSYVMAQNEATWHRTVTYDRDVQVTMSAIVGNYYPDGRDSLTMTCTKADKSSSSYDVVTEMISIDKVATCKVLTLTVITDAKSGQLGGPRFKIDLVSGASSISLLTAVLLAVWAL